MSGKPKYSNLCSAAYFGDVKKMRKLVESAGGEADDGGEERSEEAAEAAAAARRAAVGELGVVRTFAAGGARWRDYGLSFDVAATVADDPFAAAVFKHTFKPSGKSTSPATPLHWAILGNEQAAVEYLLDNGASLSVKATKFDATPDDIAAANGLVAMQNVIRTAESGLLADIDRAAADMDTCFADLADLAGPLAPDRKSVFASTRLLADLGGAVFPEKLAPTHAPLDDAPPPDHQPQQHDAGGAEPPPPQEDAPQAVDAAPPGTVERELLTRPRDEDAAAEIRGFLAAGAVVVVAKAEGQQDDAQQPAPRGAKHPVVEHHEARGWWPPPGDAAGSILGVFAANLAPLAPFARLCALAGKAQAAVCLWRTRKRALLQTAEEPDAGDTPQPTLLESLALLLLAADSAALTAALAAPGDDEEAAAPDVFRLAFTSSFAPAAAAPDADDAPAPDDGGDDKPAPASLATNRWVLAGTLIDHLAKKHAAPAPQRQKQEDGEKPADGREWVIPFPAPPAAFRDAMRAAAPGDALTVRALHAVRRRPAGGAAALGPADVVLVLEGVEAGGVDVTDYETIALGGLKKAAAAAAHAEGAPGFKELLDEETERGKTIVMPAYATYRVVEVTQAVHPREPEPTPNEEDAQENEPEEEPADGEDQPGEPAKGDAPPEADPFEAAEKAEARPPSPPPTPAPLVVRVVFEASGYPSAPVDAFDVDERLLASVQTYHRLLARVRDLRKELAALRAPPPPPPEEDVEEEAPAEEEEEEDA
ncbi:hypothetical protein DIPPA_32389 [Diplonema papillatum]|nr:hypothetical protein DIPPA_32389 [Diplonema papillatum]